VLSDELAWVQDYYTAEGQVHFIYLFNRISPEPRL
jgi:hypothetical protein